MQTHETPSPLSESALIGRVARTFKPREPLVYEFTNDTALLHQYYVMRARMYQVKHGICDFKPEPDAFDPISHILVVRRGNKVIAGCRLTVRHPGDAFALPIEEATGIDLRTALSDYCLADVTHAEMSRFAITLDTSDLTIIRQMIEITLNKAIDLGVVYGFARSPITLSRIWRMMMNNSGKATAYISENLATRVSDDTHDVKLYLNICEVHTNLVKEYFKPEPEIKDKMQPAN